MMKKLILAAAAFVAFLLMVMCTAPLAVAEEDKVQIAESSGVKYVTGGIGQDEVEEMHGMATQFSLNIAFSEGNVGRAIVGANVEVLNSQGQSVFAIDAANPLLYIDLPVGKYKVLASYNGIQQSHMVNITRSKNQRLIFNWKGFVEEDY